MVPDRIEREIVIDAPVEVVWAVVTEPDQISSWFSDSVELDLRPDGEATFVWDEHGTVRGRVERVEPPHLFAFRWVPDHRAEPADGNLLLVEFTLTPEGEGTRLTVVETGFAQLAGSDDERRKHFDGHTRGWGLELGELVAYVAERARESAER
ncbi:MAG TPA: SRPBCC family protein [Solirubrobacteraceae bacterium]|nr:SRPBCC family protein [Solirubrobacteraceae bacterium]